MKKINTIKKRREFLEATSKKYNQSLPFGIDVPIFRDGLWEELKSIGSVHYKTGGTEPVDLYAAGNMFHDFALCSIIKYAFRSRREMNIDKELLNKNLDKVIDYAQKLKALGGI